MSAGQDAYEELVMTVGSRRSGLNQNMALKNQYERVLQDLIDLVDTAQDKMTAGQKMIASSVEDVHNLLDKHKVLNYVLFVLKMYATLLHYMCPNVSFPGIFPRLRVAHGPHRDILQEN